MSELFGVSAHIDSGIRISALLIYPTLGYWGYFWCAPLWDFLVFLLLVSRGSELFGVSAQTLTVVLGFLHPYIPYQKLLWLFLLCTLWDFHVFVLLGRRVTELFGVSAQTDSGIRISALLIYPTIGYWGYFWGCNSLRLSGISTVSQERVWTLWSLSSYWLRF